MRLNKEQREALLSWVAEGLKSDEINKRASQFSPPFSVSRAAVTKGRKKKQIDLKTLQVISDNSALATGYALKEYRVQKLALLAELLERDILGDKIWLEQRKGVGSGDIAEIFDYLEFNKGEIDAYRGVLDDIASETGGRIKNLDVKSAGKELQSITVIEIVKSKDE
jgi:hypothetical protein